MPIDSKISSKNELTKRDWECYLTWPAGAIGVYPPACKPMALLAHGLEAAPEGMRKVEKGRGSTQIFTDTYSKIEIS